MSELAAQIEKLLDEARDLEYSPTRLAMTERAVELADAHHDVKIAYEARMELVGAGIFSGRPDIAMVAFSWLLTKYDAEPHRYGAYELLWRYKWILGHVVYFPSISKSQIDEMFDDMKRRFKADGSTLHAYWNIRRSHAREMEQKAEAKKAHVKLQKMPRDHLSNCQACTQNGDVSHFVFLGDDAGALTAAQPILGGRMTCSVVPESTYARVALPLIRLGDHSQALSYFKTGYRLIQRKSNYLDEKAMYIVALTLTGNLDRAVKLLDRHLPEALECVIPASQFEFYLAARMLLEKLAEAGKTTLPIRIPEKLEWNAVSKKLPVSALAEWLDVRLLDLATRFDARNGNKSFTRRVRKFRELLQYEKACKLT